MSVKFNITYECDHCDETMKQKVNVTNRFKDSLLNHPKMVKNVELPKGWTTSHDGSSLYCPKCTAQQIEIAKRYKHES